MGFELTEEQTAIRESARQGDAGRVIAYAGTGKTATLRIIAEARPRDRVLYLAFNRAIAEEARHRMPANTQARTTHQVAFAATRAWRGSRPVVSSWWRLKRDISRHESEAIEQCRMYGRGWDSAFAAVAETMTRYCNSADPLPAPHHVPRDVVTRYEVAAARLEGEPGSDQAQRSFEVGVRRALAASARRVWEAVVAHNDWPVTHDAYLKIWQLSEPVLSADLVLFDEAQDAAPVQQAVVLHQPGCVWMVGDPHQAIYEWRGAIDALSQYHAPSHPLSRSWRFGPTIAQTAGQVLSEWGVTPPLSGGGAPGAVVIDRMSSDPGYHALAAHSQRAILCRSNMGVLTAAVAELDAGRAVAVVGGGDAVADELESAVALWYGQRPRHADLRDFTQWEELELMAHAPSGVHWRPIVKLVSGNPDRATRLAQRLRRELVSESLAGVVISTGHKAKGRQWPAVVLGEDWQSFRNDDDTVNESEARLWYVACTRAMTVLDLSRVQAEWTRNFS